MKRKLITLITFAALMATLTIAGISHSRGSRRTLGHYTTVNNSCVCVDPGEISVPPCSGECELPAQWP